MAATETIRFETPAGLWLAGVLHRPQIEDNGLGVVVAHGMLSSKDSDKHRLICEAVAAGGATALRFDFRGRGESDGDPSDLTVSNEVEDLLASIAFLSERGQSRIAVVGSSLGGTVALLAGSVNRDPAGLVTIAAPARLPDKPRPAWGGSGTVVDEDPIEVAPGEFIHHSFFIDAERHDPIGAARSIGCPWLIIHGAADEVVPVQDAGFLADAAPASELKIHPTAGHRFDQPGERKWLVATVAGFISDLS
jgi:pimeloyl-ACP methyl ester carboxylesterase